MLTASVDNTGLSYHRHTRKHITYLHDIIELKQAFYACYLAYINHCVISKDMTNSFFFDNAMFFWKNIQK